MAEFGKAINVVDDLPIRWEPYVDGIANLARAIARRLTTPRGGLFYAPDYGLDIRGMIGGTRRADEFSSWESAIAAEAEKDDRVDAATATVTYDFANATATVRVDLDTSEGPFSLVLSVDDVSASVVEVG